MAGTERDTNEEMSKTKEKLGYGIEYFTGIRPSGDLTVANFLGAVRPLLDLQREHKTMVFVADIHALTDNEYDTVRHFTPEVVADYLALGLDPSKVDIFVQSELLGEVSTLTLLLMRHMTVSQAMRVPALKDKLKDHDHPERANLLLTCYPIMMAADILLQQASVIPVGEDQVSHMEVTRNLASSFNQTYGQTDTFVVPKTYAVKALRIKSLNGVGKMSKSQPEGAIFLTDEPSIAAKKIKRAVTGMAGEMNEIIASHIELAKGLNFDPERARVLDEIIAAHMSGTAVMGDFKKLMTDIVVEFLENFQKRRKEITQDPSYIPSVLAKGREVAKQNATKTLESVFVSLSSRKRQ
ncbi:tryptophan--tRNA ligase [Candidatus Woesebacteria bacterium RIFCSPHIGHO2_01_FULL_44_10]|uniref:Tryptophan--tRNA ligase n=1 Tax=Candidatus Woesebacteria bacterium RIFCSPLOWO2_01_FULL_44_14 TaxID=1802525 RepID=A0A1F8C3K3_9BACT|nr:MAG: tryptophan--tRNA ligase [Candidatus Woesebacteria bacterium RIFCSPHIGHO2_01_FULL_44_10]OGM55604.1 MAG: tryptophan--tRNA ligase [Candidatus Woesebacteria bacterium RIFCSPHIGHO2_12_FULL_44_11]OGM70877.1 MAG: tryptophan--tRNA ligase [Candidatus Woesebacteria bacterium RIFCSPLOWO2_01_FULL_44_14]